MTPQIWLALGIWSATVIAQIAIGVFGGRVKRAETAIETINRRRSDEEDKMQHWIGDVDVRLARIEMKLNMHHDRKETRW